MKEKSALKERKGVVGWITVVVLTLYSLTMILLFVWGISASLKTRGNWLRDTVFLPEGNPLEWAWSNFKTIWDNFVVKQIIDGEKIEITFLGLLVNTLVYTIGSAFVATAASCIVSYCVAKFAYRFSAVVYTFVLIAMVVPIIGSTPSMLLLLDTLNIYDNYISMFIMKFTYLDMYFLVFHAIYKNISPEFSEAALLDGANEWQVFFKIMLPLVMPTFLTVFLIKFIEHWNDYQWVLMFLPSSPTLSYGVYYMEHSGDNDISAPPYKMASCVLMATPILVLFIVFRNKILGNLTMGGVKE